MTLSRIIRKQEQALTIWKFLDFVESNLEIFSYEAFVQRMKQKPDYEEYGEYRVKSHTLITQKEIEEDKQKLLSLEQTIKKLITWRDKVIAHIDEEFLLTGKIISEEYPLQRQQLQEVIDTLFKILNRYSYAYDSSTWVEKFVGEDDVQYVMDSIRFKKEERKKQIEELRRQARDKK